MGMPGGEIIVDRDLVVTTRDGVGLAIDVCRNPISGEREGVMEHPRVTRNQVFADAVHPSHMLLPVIRASA